MNTEPLPHKPMELGKDYFITYDGVNIHREFAMLKAENEALRSVVRHLIGVINGHAFFANHNAKRSMDAVVRELDSIGRP